MIVDFRKVKTLVIKVGTHSLTKRDGKLDQQKITLLVEQIAKIKQGRSVVLVSSGAVGAGIGELALRERPRALSLLQATAAVGQSVLMSVYRDLFKAQGIIVAQILLAEEDFSNRRRYLNFRNTIHRLLREGVIPIINENDVIATHELKVGDNDTLSAMIAANIKAELLIMLSDIDGLYDRDPNHRSARLIEEVHEITPEIEKLSGKGKGYSVGGIHTKVEAARICMKAGITMSLVDGSKKGVIHQVLENTRIGTVFLPQEPANSKEQWLRIARPKGIITIDQGAEKAVLSGKSLLARGIHDVRGIFDRGDLVIIQGPKKEIGKGLSEYSSDMLGRIKGRTSETIEKLLGFASPAIKHDNFITY
ncbi:MAG: glutamate 5-kinase [DPANN group archaeon]|nr:glutamate 5-kinase [DPANN group archaeon]